MSAAPRMRCDLAVALPAVWQDRGPIAWLLLPIALAFAVAVACRRFLYRRGILASLRLSVPVIVVGNITAGGAGKTPLCLWLVDRLIRAGRRPGIVSRGYGAASRSTCEVSVDADPAAVGDEPLLLRRRSGCPVFVGRDRVAAARRLLAAHPGCDVIVADDGLQHYRLARDVEIAVVDGRGLGNGWPLPAGPLREPAARLRSVDAVLLNGLGQSPLAAPRTYRMTLEGRRFQRLDDPGRSCPPADLRGRRLHACAGIGAPQRFFDYLTSLGLEFVAHPFPDHHRYSASDLAFSGCDAILMTEKDAIKCAGLSPHPVWVLPVTAVVEAGLVEFLMEKIDGRPPA